MLKQKIRSTTIQSLNLRAGNLNHKLYILRDKYLTHTNIQFEKEMML